MLTGDGKTTAEAVGKELGIDEVVAEIFPEDKATIVQRLRSEGRVVAMAGDGVNDAPALAAAEVGIAMGTGTDVAMESAGVTLFKGDLMGIVRARKLSHATMKNIRQNLFLSFAYNVAGIPLAAGVLYPFFGLLLSPVVAAAAMALSSVSVIANALRLRTVEGGLSDASEPPRGWAEWLMFSCGSGTSAWACTSIVIRPPLLPEDLRYMGTEASAIAGAVPMLADWLKKCSPSWVGSWRGQECSSRTLN